MASFAFVAATRRLRIVMYALDDVVAVAVWAVNFLRPTQLSNRFVTLVFTD
jgi:hypothetical protein